MEKNSSLGEESPEKKTTESGQDVIAELKVFKQTVISRLGSIEDCLDTLKCSSKTDELAPIYKEVSENWRYFLEWRYKIISRLFVGCAGGIYASKVLYDMRFYDFLFLPSLLTMLLFIAVYYMGERNKEVISKTESAAKALEDQTSVGDGFYKSYPQEEESTTFSYYQIIKVVTVAGLLIFAFATICTLDRYNLQDFWLSTLKSVGTL